jgi:hypothetical protein
MGLRHDPVLALTITLGFLMGKPRGAFPLESWATLEDLEMGRVY